MATLLALAIYSIALAPFLWMALKPAAARWLAPITGAVAVAVAIYQTGVLSMGAFAPTDVARLVPVDSVDSRCEQMVDVLMENQILLERPKADRIVVRGATWNQLPESIRGAVVDCVTVLSAAPGDQNAPEIIVR